ncbi:hypothetical protein RHMOL_Rhmol10G0079500 [Rhododendron molle]|uniref:Uncharacterized protein n=1 Tax=Rhododendron molle TaxID=49168 RepID=A0ACC0M1S3_RHOML|nr:hypothetical protein RHMOL_Rhmol10G0079500 [Rhododendron molle]
MAVVSKLLSISSPSPQFRKPRSSFNFNPVTSASPFTEKHSIERYRRESTWLLSTNQLNRPVSFPPDSDPSSIRERDIALQLPELKRLLEVLREKRESGGGGGGGERCREITQTGSIEHSIHVFRWMKNQKNYCARNDIYNMMIRFHARHNQTDQARGLFFEMQERRCKPDAETFNALINVHGRAGQWRWAMNIKDDMLRAAVCICTLLPYRC